MITFDRLKELLIYDPETGIFTARVRRRAGPKGCLEPGSEPGSKTTNGYIELSLDGKRYLGHRLAHLYMTGEWPENQIDHRDGNKANNRWNNLRQATNAQNNWNKGAPSNNKSGVKGVIWRKEERRWKVQIMANGKRKCIGSYQYYCSAVIARKKAEIEFHGEFAKKAA